MPNSFLLERSGKKRSQISSLTSELHSGRPVTAFCRQQFVTVARLLAVFRFNAINVRNVIAFELYGMVWYGYSEKFMSAQTIRLFPSSNHEILPKFCQRVTDYV